MVAEWQRLTRERLASLERILKAAERSDDAKLLAELPAMKEELEAGRRALARMVISGQRTDKLRAEWHDWERHAAYVDDANHAVKRDRQEMIASELRTRGVRLSSVEAPAAEPVMLRIPESDMQDVTDAPALNIPAAVITEWDVSEEEEAPELSEAVAYWDGLIASLPPDQSDERSLARLLRAFREVHGVQKSQDRRTGTRRYRLAAFDAWS